MNGNGIDIVLSFLEGLALIASPCILPVLPLVLSTSIDGGKKRPFGIITGFVVAFSVFVLVSRRLVEVFHVDTDAIRYVSLGLLFFLGLTLLSEKLSESFSRLTQGAADFGAKFGEAGKDGFGSGMVIGALIGLVWTPCAGPILAAVLVQVIRQHTDAQSIFVTTAFALGAGIPMFVIAMTGRKIMKRFGFLTHHSKAVRKVFAGLILASVAYMAFGTELPSLTQAGDTPAVQVAEQTGAQLENPLDKPYPAPEFTGIQQWLNSKPLTMNDLKGKVVLIDFWTYSCINCVRTLPYVTAWDKKYRDKGLVIIGVHAPEFEFEKNVDNIKAALVHNGIEYPVAVDNDLATWLAYQNRFWPAHYLIDKNGQVVYTHFGEGHYDVTENNIRYLLGLKGKVSIAAKPPTAIDQTPETYLGYARAQRFIGAVLPHHDASGLYQASETLPENHWTLGGMWKISGQKITALKPTSVLRLNFSAKKVFLVMGTTDGTPQKIMLTLNGQPLTAANAGKDVVDGAVTVNGHTLYELVSQPEVKNGVLEIQPSAAGFEAYAFTFGN